MPTRWARINDSINTEASGCSEPFYICLLPVLHSMMSPTISHRFWDEAS
jgi:hypothetical protein